MIPTEAAPWLSIFYPHSRRVAGVLRHLSDAAGETAVSGFRHVWKSGIKGEYKISLWKFIWKYYELLYYCAIMIFNRLVLGKILQ